MNTGNLLVLKQNNFLNKREKELKGGLEGRCKTDEKVRERSEKIQRELRQVRRIETVSVGERKN